MPEGWFTEARREFHASLLAGSLTRNDKGIPSNADSSSRPSINIATTMLELLGPSKTAPKLSGQTAGARFETLCEAFLRVSFKHMEHLRPGQFFVLKGPSIAEFEQYAHLASLEDIADQNREVAIALGSDYLIKPDVIIARKPEDDSVINAHETLVDMETARLTSLREVNQRQNILHASVSCKWTMRSDRAQNARSEGLNLVRNRKGRLPHVVVTTAEPLPSRLASLALGTGDIDCVYHFALHELREALRILGREESTEQIDGMVEGKRLRDISDLPLDLVT